MWYQETSLEPRSGWVFEDAVTGVVTNSSDYKSLIREAARRREINGTPIGDIEAEVNDYLCSVNPPNFCTSARGLGDVVANWLKPAADALGVSGCSGCARRRAALNTLVPL